MKTLVMTLLVLSAGPLVIPAAHADIPPPRIHPVKPRPKLPEGITVTFKRLELALRGGDEAAAKAEIDPRGWDDNLVGGSGNALSSLVSQGIRKKWYPRAKASSFVKVGQAYVVSADIVQYEDDRVSDTIDMLLVEVEGRWLVLGAGEKTAEVRLLAARLRDGKPLAPPSETP